MTAPTPTVGRDVRDGIGWLAIDHPPVNVLTRSVLAELHEGIDALAADSAVRAIVLCAAGKHFSAGADVGEHLPPHYEELIPTFLATVRAVYDCPLPVVASVQGRCVGAGLELVAAADVVVAEQGASLGQPEIQLGVIPPAACALLPRICAPGAAAEIILTGDLVSAEEAQRMGLVRRVVPDGEGREAARGLAERIARHSRAAIVMAKRALRHGTSGTAAEGLAAAGTVYTEELMATADAVEGLRAFVEKRSPTWAHR